MAAQDYIRGNSTSSYIQGNASKSIGMTPAQLAAKRAAGGSTTDAAGPSLQYAYNGADPNNLGALAGKVAGRISPTQPFGSPTGSVPLAHPTAGVIPGNHALPPAGAPTYPQRPPISGGSIPGHSQPGGMPLPPTLTPQQQFGQQLSHPAGGIVDMHTLLAHWLASRMQQQQAPSPYTQFLSGLPMLQ